MQQTEFTVTTTACLQVTGVGWGRRTYSSVCICFHKTPNNSQAAIPSTTGILAGTQSRAAMGAVWGGDENHNPLRSEGRRKKQKHPPSFPVYRLASAACLSGPSTGYPPPISLTGKSEGTCYSVDEGSVRLSFLSPPWRSAGHWWPTAFRPVHGAPCYCSPLHTVRAPRLIFTGLCIRLWPVLTFHRLMNSSC